MRRVFVLALLLAAAICRPAMAAELSDITPFKDKSRIISIGGSLTEIVYALGEEKDLVARDLTGNYPPAALELPSVGYMRALTAEGVLSVNPTGILAIEGSGPPDALALISKAGVPFNLVPEGFSRQGIVQKVLAVGKALSAESKARLLADKLDAELTASEALTRAVPEAQRKRVLFVLSLANGKITASGTGTGANGIIAMAGAINAVGNFAGYKALTEEAVAAAKPDAILVMSNGGDGSASVDQLLANPAVRLTPAGQNKAIYAMDGEYLLGFGPRTPAALRDLVEALYGRAPGGQ